MEIMEDLNKSCEPMEVDLSANSVTHMDISYGDSLVGPDVSILKEERPDSPIINYLTTMESNSDQTSSIKVYHIIKKQDKNTFSTSLVVSFVIILILSMLAYYIDVKCNGELDSNFLKEKLYRKVYGQYGALNEIIWTLNNEAPRKLLFFYGGTGVGKTYTVSLMMENQWNYSNVYHYTMPSFTSIFSTEFMLGLTLCKNSIFIVDDLISNDVMTIKAHIKNIIEKSEELDKNILTILVFNCDNSPKDITRKCDEDFKDELLNQFSDVKALKHFIRFDSLTEQHLKKCVEEEIGSKHISQIEFRNILKNFNVSTDGCKGVHQKIKILNIV